MRVLACIDNKDEVKRKQRGKKKGFFNEKTRRWRAIKTVTKKVPAVLENELGQEHRLGFVFSAPN